MSQIALWNELHEQAQHQLGYPSEHVVRFLSDVGPGNGRWALDIGCGAGRHSKLLVHYGWDVTAIDGSRGAVDLVKAEIGEDVGVTCGKMTALPWVDDTFALAIAYGVFYYGDLDDHLRAVRELHRVLKPGAEALVVVRSMRDSRTTNGKLVSRRTWEMLSGSERGMRVSFLRKSDVEAFYGEVFSELVFERSETTRNGQSWVDSDWVIRVKK